MNEQSGSDLMSFAKEVLGNHCSPIYGAEQKDLESILKSDDLRCEVLLSTVEPSSSPGTQPSSPVPLGLVVYKIKPTDEFARFGVTNSLEIKTLCLADPPKSRGKGYRSFLLSQAVNFARSISSSSVHVTVSDTKRDLYTFFLDKGFKEQAALSNNLLGGEAPEKLYVLRLSAGDKDRAQKRASADSEPTATPSSDSQPRKRIREDSEIKTGASGDSIPQKRPRVDPEAHGATSDNSLHQKRQRTDDSGRDFAEMRDSWTRKRPREEGSFTSSFSARRKNPWRLPLRQPYLQWIKEGKKTVEGRINTGLPARFRPGDEVVFFGGQNSVTVQVTKVDTFKSFQDMLQETTVGKCLPDYANRPVDDAVRLYRSFPGYADKERQFGVLAIHITCLPSN
eukprot:Em0008g1133a